MTIPSLSALVITSGRKRWHLPTRRHRERAAVQAQNLYLASTSGGVPLAMIENDPMLLHLVVEDLCWRLEADCLGRYKPRHGDSAAQERWLAERKRLEAERRRLAAAVTQAISTL